MRIADAVTLYEELTGKGFKREAVLSLLESREDAPTTAKPQSTPEPKAKPRARRNNDVLFPGRKTSSKADQVIALLVTGPKSFGPIADAVGGSRGALSTLMGRLRRAGKVVRDQEGRYALPFVPAATSAAR